jgi:hypothetical protein
MEVGYLFIMSLVFLLVTGCVLASDSLRGLFKKVGPSVCVLKIFGNQNLTPFWSRNKFPSVFCLARKLG